MKVYQLVITLKDNSDFNWGVLDRLRKKRPDLELIQTIENIGQVFKTATQQVTSMGLPNATLEEIG